MRGQKVFILLSHGPLVHINKGVMLTVRTVIINVMAREEKYNCCHSDHPSFPLPGRESLVVWVGWLVVCRSHVELIYLSGGGAVGEGWQELQDNLLFCTQPPTHPPTPEIHF